MAGLNRRSRARRGLTLVEMLVTVTVLVIIMSVVVRVFQIATSSVSSAQASIKIDQGLQHLDRILRADLRGATARFTPPLDPKDNLGYFEYGENSFADVQGEDSDDYIRFTTKAPIGQPFTGRLFLPPPATLTAAQHGVYLRTQPITIESEYADVVYFLRNGNLYRRVLLVVPQRQATIAQAYGNLDLNGRPFTPLALGADVPVSWQGVNDVSARPGPSGPAPATDGPPQSIIVNSLGDLTNRENRFASPRFANDFLNNATGAPGPDGLPDDSNADGVPDFYPTLYYHCPWIFAPGYTSTPPGGTPQTMAFPFVFPGAYSNPESTDPGVGWIHSPVPDHSVFPFSGNPLMYLRRLNHNPLDIGDNLYRPDQTSILQTWWGFPTWRETLSVNWTDPTVQVNRNGTQPFGLTPRPADAIPVADDSQLLPPITGDYRVSPQLYTDSKGSRSSIISGDGAMLWPLSWEDDLIMSGVRSFDVKVYEDVFGGYMDLGWGDDVRITQQDRPAYLAATPPIMTWGGRTVPSIEQTFAHEGRMPPLINDNRSDSQFGFSPYPGYVYSGNIGDDSATIPRLRRVWDSWSTEYTNAPGHSINNILSASNGWPSGSPWGPPFQPPVYPSYPPPYPVPLRAIQIQVRAVDPANQRVKMLTIRQDFSDKL